MSQYGEISIRPMAWEDVDRIVEEFNDTWSSEESGTAEVSLLNSRHFVMRYLTGTTRARIAELDGQIMGVTLLGVQGQPLLFEEAQTQLKLVDATLQESSIGRKNLNSMLLWHQLEDDLEESVAIAESTQAELKLFLVTAAARGKGVGGKLWCDMLVALKQKGVERFFLHTDSSCDVSYYDHIGMKCIASIMGADHPETVDDRGGFYDDIFIYSGDVNKQMMRWDLKTDQLENDNSKRDGENQ